MINQTVRIATIIRTKDRPHLLARCLTSLVKQNRKPDEVVIVNDGGQSVTEIVSRFPELNSHLLDHKSSQGRARAGNLGVEATQSDVIGFLDDDDCFLPDHLQRLEIAMTHFDVQVAYAGCSLLQQNLTDEEATIQVEPLGQYNEPFDVERLHYENYIPLISLLIKRDLWLRVGGFDETFNLFEDWDILLRLARKTTFYHLDRVTSEYTVWGKNQITRATNKTQWMIAYRQFLDKHVMPLAYSDKLAFLANYWIISQERRGIVQKDQQEKQALQIKVITYQQKFQELQHQVQQYETQNTFLQQQLSQLQTDSAKQIAQCQDNWAKKYEQLQTEYKQSQMAWAEKYEHLQRDWANKYEKAQEKSVEQYIQLQTQIEKKLSTLETDYQALQQSAKRQNQQYAVAQSTLHELSKLMTVGLNRTSIENILLAKPQPVYALSFEAEEVVADYQRLVAWIQTQGITLPNEDFVDVPPPRPLSEVYPTLITFSRAQVMEQMPDRGPIPFLLDPDKVLVFTTYCTANDFSRFDMALATRVRINTCQIRVIIRELGDVQPIRQWQFSAISVLDNRFHPISFAPIPDSLGKTYQIEIDSPNADAQNGIAVWCHSRKPALIQEQTLAEEILPPTEQLPQWIQQRLRLLPLSPRLTAQSMQNLFLIFSITPATPLLDVHLFLTQLSKALEQADMGGQIRLCGEVSHAVREYCEQQQIPILDTETFVTALPQIQMEAVDYVWCCDLYALPQTDTVERAQEMFVAYPKAGLLIPLERQTDGYIRAGYAVLLREGMIKPSASGMPADHPYHGYRRIVVATNSHLVVFRQSCLPHLDFTQLATYHLPMYQMTELLWQLKVQRWDTLYEGAFSYEHNRPYPQPTEETYTQDCQHFYRRWRNRLPQQANPLTQLTDLINPQGLSTVLIIDATLPTYDQDSGSFRLFTLLKIWLSLGYRLTFFPDNLDANFKYRHALEALGIEVFHSGYGIHDALAYRSFDLAFICRVDIGHRYIPFIRLISPNTKIFYDTVDIHYIREQRQAEIENNQHLKQQAQETKRRELSNCLLADHVITVTEEDGYHLQQSLPELDFSVIPNVHPLQPRPPNSFAQREGLVFIGNYNHQPNEDAVYFFVEQVLPKIKAHLPTVRLYLIGSHMKPAMQALASQDIEVVGWVEAVEPEFAKRRIFVSYLRYGAGMKGKLGQALSVGLPVVTTTIGAEGMGLKNEETAMIADDPAHFASAVCQLYTDRTLWDKLSQQGYAYIEQCFGEGAVRERLQALLANR